MKLNVFSIGHSSHSIDRFLSLLSRHNIQAIADVRSAPYSKFNPQFNRKELQKTLAEAGVKYVFLGRELGARSDDPNCYLDDKVQYDRLAKTKLFQLGIDRLIEGAQTYKIAMMCAEKEPLECHRTILVARELSERGADVTHILADGSLEEHMASIDRLVVGFGLAPDDMFRNEVINEAYAKQADKIAYDKSGHQISKDLQDEERDQSRNGP